MKDFSKVSRKITRTLFLAQSSVSAGLIALATVNAIAGAELSGVATWAGLPMAVLMFATAFGALGWGIVMGRIGRRGGLTAGLVLGAGGSFLAGGAIINGSFWWFLAGLALVGLAQAAMQLGRFAAADVNMPKDRGRAVANVVIGGTVGSILGPLLVAPAGRVAANLGFNELAGSYAIAMVLLALAAAIIFIWLRPEPSKIARELAEQISSAKEHLLPARLWGKS